MNIGSELKRRFPLQKEYLGANKPVCMITPVVSVLVFAYNHNNHIRQCLDGILMQETGYPFEIVIGEDGSDDGTRETCMAYADRHPDKIRLFLRDRNDSQFYDDHGNVIARFNIYWTMMSARGEYAALCEGDDYWTDPLKLQKQMTFMMKHPHLSMSFHSASKEYADGSRNAGIHRHYGRQFLTAEEVIMGGGGLYPTCSSMFRRDVTADFPDFLLESPVGDMALALNALARGSVGYMDEVMAVYNVGVPGSWSDQAKMWNLHKWVKHALKCEIVRCAYDQYTSFRHTYFLKKRNSLSFCEILANAQFDIAEQMPFYKDLKGRIFLRDRFFIRLHFFLNALPVLKKLDYGLGVRFYMKAAYRLLVPRITVFMGKIAFSRKSQHYLPDLPR
jgi:glycosyltransferase involved in cell wall biosynthesis